MAQVAPACQDRKQTLPASADVSQCVMQSYGRGRACCVLQEHRVSVSHRYGFPHAGVFALQKPGIVTMRGDFLWDNMERRTTCLEGPRKEKAYESRLANMELTQPRASYLEYETCHSNKDRGWNASLKPD